MLYDYSYRFRLALHVVAMTIEFCGLFRPTSLTFLRTPNEYHQKEWEVPRMFVYSLGSSFHCESGLVPANFQCS